MAWLAIVLTFNFDSAKTHGSSKLIFNTAFYLFVVVNARYIVNLKVLPKLTLYLVVVNIPFVAVMIRRRVGFSITSICSLYKKITNNLIIFALLMKKVQCSISANNELHYLVSLLYHSGTNRLNRNAGSILH